MAEFASVRTTEKDNWWNRINGTLPACHKDWHAKPWLAPLGDTCQSFPGRGCFFLKLVPRHLMRTPLPKNFRTFKALGDSKGWLRPWLYLTTSLGLLQNPIHLDSVGSGRETSPGVFNTSVGGHHHCVRCSAQAQPTGPERTAALPMGA